MYSYYGNLCKDIQMTSSGGMVSIPTLITLYSDLVVLNISLLMVDIKRFTQINMKCCTLIKSNFPMGSYFSGIPENTQQAVVNILSTELHSSSCKLQKLAQSEASIG